VTGAYVEHCGKVELEIVNILQNENCRTVQGLTENSGMTDLFLWEGSAEETAVVAPRSTLYLLTLLISVRSDFDISGGSQGEVQP